MKGYEINLSITLFVITSFAYVLSNKAFHISRWNVCPPENTAIWTVFGISIDQCVFECFMRPSCHLIGYRTVLNFCKLHTSSNFPDTHDNNCLRISRNDILIEEDCTCKEWEICSRTGITTSCVRKECPPLMSLYVGSYLGNRNYFNAKRRVQCDYGYSEQRDITGILCLNNGEWSQNVTCIPVDCGELPTIYNGTITLDILGHTSYTATATVTCNVGYQPRSSSISCLGSGKWQSANCDLVCPSNDRWLNFTNAFKIHFWMDLHTHQTAKDSCIASGMTGLLKLNEAWKMKNVIEVLKYCEGYKSLQFWLDGKSEDLATAWHFSDGEEMTLDGPIYWKSGQPDLTRPNCITLKNLSWNDRWCCKLYPFICEL